ncbi:unnamed protein product, partial [Mesorhabditis belari]|uniref:Protein kinase domain-containing protein n=1 Tax=Mesorhabditis belari TaxID=2138241 RepID=A0AAF3EC99_9BILA
METSTSLVSCVGTYRYMSPEVYGYPPRGPRQKPTAQIDVYSAGLVLWEIVERRLVHSKFGPTNFNHPLSSTISGMVFMS